LLKSFKKLLTIKQKFDTIVAT